MSKRENIETQYMRIPRAGAIDRLLLGHENKTARVHSSPRLGIHNHLVLREAVPSLRVILGLAESFLARLSRPALR